MSLVRHLSMVIGTVAMLLPTLPAAAQDAARDPTVAPGETGATSQSPAGVEGMTVLVRDDKPYLMVGARLYAPGDKVGNLRVERITEKEVWFHDGAALIKVPRFAGIERKTIAAKPLCAAPTPSTPLPNAEAADGPSAHPVGKAKIAKRIAKHSSHAPASVARPAVAPCEDAQP